MNKLSGNDTAGAEVGDGRRGVARARHGRRRKLIVVSNRGPVTFARDRGGERIARRGGGGLVTALRSLVSHHDVTWIASAMTDEDRAVVAEAGGAAIDEHARDGSAFRLRLVAHDETAYDWFYNVVSNPMLWFLQHYLWELAYTPSVDLAFQHAWDEGYTRVNEGFAEAVLEELELEPDAAVFFHDYQLYLAPRLVRERAPDALLAHFVHIPWPQADYWHVLPEPIRAGRPRRPARQRRGRLPHAPLAAQLPADARATSRAPRATSARAPPLPRPPRRS